MKYKIEIKTFIGEVLYTLESDVEITVRDALIEAHCEGADLRGSDLRNTDLEGADLRYAYLGGADLRGASLEGARLEGANLLEADFCHTRGINVFSFQHGGHSGYYYDGAIRIGCHIHSVGEWLNKYEVIGKKAGYTEKQIKSYGRIIKFISKHLMKDEVE